MPIHFSLIIPKMFVFNIALSCLTTSNFPWFMDLTSQVPKQDSSLHYQNLLPPSDSHNWELFLLWLCLFFLSGVISCSSSVVYWTPTNLGRIIFWCYIFLPFHTVIGVLKTWILKWFAIHLSYTDTLHFIFKIIQVLIIVFLFNHLFLKIFFGRSWHFLLIWKKWLSSLARHSSTYQFIPWPFILSP